MSSRCQRRSLMEVLGVSWRVRVPDPWFILRTGTPFLNSGWGKKWMEKQKEKSDIRDRISWLLVSIASVFCIQSCGVQPGNAEIPIHYFNMFSPAVPPRLFPHVCVCVTRSISQSYYWTLVKNDSENINGTVIFDFPFPPDPYSINQSSIII